MMIIEKIIIALLISMQLNGIMVSSIDNINIRTSIDFNGIENLILPKDGNIKIAVIDTGVNTSNYLFHGANIVNIDISDKSTKPNYNHGTMVTGIIVEILRLTAPEVLSKAELISVRMGNEDMLVENDLIRAIEKAISLDVDVINISACIYTPSPHLKEAVDKAIAKNILIVASVGNDYYSGYSYPASYDGVIAVSALDRDGSIFDMANKNDRISVCAPGVDIPTADPDNKVNLVKFTGTSAAAPFVTALASIIKYEHKNITDEELKGIIEDTAIDLGKPGKDNTYGYGLIDYKKALERVDHQNEISVQ